MKISHKKWLCIFVGAALLVAALFVALNALVDPFGVFGDRVIGWWSYGMTQNPRTAKIGWLEENHEQYDSYIIGCSKTSSYPVELLNAYYDASFYNMTMYGGDLYDAEMTVRYLLGNYGARNIIVNTGLSSLMSFSRELDSIKANLHAKVDGSSQFLFYMKYLTLHPQYSIDKIRAYSSNSYLVGANSVFVPETGTYNKSVRDIEPIGELGAYLDLYPAFLDMPWSYQELPAVDECLDAIARMKRLCEDAGASFTIVIPPTYHIELDLYSYSDDFSRFFKELAEITDYWDFSGYHPISYEPRYFYDNYHFRNNVGAMMLARMNGNTGIYYPDDFGVYVTADNVAERLEEYRPEGSPPKGALTKRDALSGMDIGKMLPILMYHCVNERNSDETQVQTFVSPEVFRSQMSALKDAGYETILFQQVLDYVQRGDPLPENPIIITFDDGYTDNLAIAAPILKELGMCAVINVIGVSAGKDTYKDKGVPIFPHFSLDEALPWVDSGVIEIGSHSYDMHQVRNLDGDDSRQGVTKREGESEAEYIAAFREDFMLNETAIEAALGRTVNVYAYPFGFHNQLSEVLISEMGTGITLTIEEGVSTVVKGLPQSLRLLLRCNVTENMTGEDIIKILEDYKEGNRNDREKDNGLLY